MEVGVRLAIVGFVVVLAGCQESAAKAPQAPVQQGTPTTKDSDVLATIGDEKITMVNVRERTGELLDQLDLQYQQQRDKLIAGALDSIVLERLFTDEAKKQGKTAVELVSSTLASAGEPSDLEIEAWYKDNQSRIGNRTLAEVKSQIAALLQKQRRTAAVEKLTERLRTERKVTYAFEPHRMQFKNDGAPTLGKADAPVTLVEFSDFQCPYCQATAPTLKEVAQKYGDKVHIVYRQFPIASIHPFAFKAAEASLCANDQGKFWALHDMMFQDQTKLTVTDLKDKARRLGLDEKKFNQCLDGGRFVEQVQNDQKEGRVRGVNGTPALFVNGVYVEGGAVPYSTLSALIDKELARKSH
jgi:protein-disulfide isomerase